MTKHRVLIPHRPCGGFYSGVQVTCLGDGTSSSGAGLELVHSVHTNYQLPVKLATEIPVPGTYNLDKQPSKHCTIFV